MNLENFGKVLRALIHRKPFKPFTVELKTGVRVEIDHSEATVIREGVAVFIGPGFVPTYFDHDSVTQIIDAPARSGKRNGSCQVNPITMTSSPFFRLLIS